MARRKKIHQIQTELVRKNSSLFVFGLFTTIRCKIQQTFLILTVKVNLKHLLSLYNQDEIILKSKPDMVQSEPSTSDFVFLQSTRD